MINVKKNKLRLGIVHKNYDFEKKKHFKAYKFWKLDNEFINFNLLLLYTPCLKIPLLSTFLELNKIY